MFALFGSIYMHLFSEYLRKYISKKIISNAVYYFQLPIVQIIFLLFWDIKKLIPMQLTYIPDLKVFQHRVNKHLFYKCRNNLNWNTKPHFLFFGMLCHDIGIYMNFSNYQKRIKICGIFQNFCVGNQNGMEMMVNLSRLMKFGVDHLTRVTKFRSTKSHMHQAALINVRNHKRKTKVRP